MVPSAINYDVRSPTLGDGKRVLLPSVMKTTNLGHDFFHRPCPGKYVLLVLQPYVLYAPSMCSPLSWAVHYNTNSVFPMIHAWVTNIALGLFVGWASLQSSLRSRPTTNRAMAHSPWAGHCGLDYGFMALVPFDFRT